MDRERMAYLEPLTTFSGEVATAYSQGRFILVGQPTNVDVLRAIHEKKVERAIVAVENLLGDVVDDVVAYLIAHAAREPWFKIIGEALWPIKQTLVGKKGIDISQVTKVSSHIQAFAQCRNFLSNHMTWEKIPASSTAAAAKRVAQEQADNIVAIAAPSVVDYYPELEILAENIGDSPNNMTRFLIFGAPESEPTGNDKTTLFVTTDDKPGALCDVLLPFKFSRINLSKIDSRTARTKMGEAVFWLDVRAHVHDNCMRVILDKLKKYYVKELRIIGSYSCTY